MSKKILKSVYMSGDIWKEIKKESKKIERSSNWLIADILKSWLKNKIKKREKRK